MDEENDTRNNAVQYFAFLQKRILVLICLNGTKKRLSLLRNKRISTVTCILLHIQLNGNAEFLILIEIPFRYLYILRYLRIAFQLSNFFFAQQYKFIADSVNRAEKSKRLVTDIYQLMRRIRRNDK